MPLQDLTPQLRTRLSRVERIVGLFVSVATLLLLAGFAYYLHHTAQKKGWFLTKAPYFVYLHSGAGFKVGDTVRLLGFDAGEITKITAAKPYEYDEKGRMVDVYIEFYVHAPYIGYVWDDSVVKIRSAGLLGARFLEVTKGGTSGSTNKLFPTYQEAGSKLTGILIPTQKAYTNIVAGAKYHLEADEPPDLSSQMDDVMKQVKAAIPTILNLTNQIAAVMANAQSISSNVNTLSSNANRLIAAAQPIVTNLHVITGNLKEPRGSLGEWLIPTNLNSQLEQTLGTTRTTLTNASATLTNLSATVVTAGATMTNLSTTLTNVNLTLLTANQFVGHTDTNLTALLDNVGSSLTNLANLTSNLNAQVQGNPQLVAEIGHAIVSANDLMQGLKRHWLLRSAFKTNKAPATATPPKK
ncbi:hypothetical protein LBMAG56_09590 [Verrucomicrobiota bacterium]|nr:hypothetical protein LBMAG56_09590 [Verrucomicrobiota bacterium]